MNMGWRCCEPTLPLRLQRLRISFLGHHSLVAAATSEQVQYRIALRASCSDTKWLAIEPAIFSLLIDDFPPEFHV